MENNECTTLSIRYPSLEERMNTIDFVRRVVGMERRHTDILLEYYRLMKKIGFRFYPSGDVLKADLDLEEFRKGIDPRKPPKLNIKPSAFKSPEIFPELLGKENKNEDPCTG